MKLFLKPITYTLFICLVSGLLSCSDNTSSLNKKLDKLIQETLPDATVGVYIQHPDGTPVYQHLPNTLLSPASNIKLYTTAAALYFLGPDYRYNTSVSQSKDDVYITFSGAPDFTSQNLNELIQPISAIKGNIVLDVNKFKPPFYPGGVSYDDLGWYYTAPCSSVIIDRNMVDYDAISPKSPDDQPMQFIPKDTHSPLTLINNAKAVAPLFAEKHCTFNVEIKSHNTLHLFGCFPRDNEKGSLSFSIPDPVLFAKQLIRREIQANHVSFKGKIITGSTPETATTISQHLSAPLEELLDYMVKNSNNLYADSVTRTLGYELTHEGTTKQGIYAINQILTEQAAMNMNQISLADGMGTRYDLTTAKHISMLLSHLYQNTKIYPLFIRLLPVMGVSGTLKDRMKGSLLENRVFAKTGTMHDISALSGFIKMPNGKTLIFSIIINGVLSDINKARQLEEQILLEVAKENL